MIAIIYELGRSISQGTVNVLKFQTLYSIPFFAQTLLLLFFVQLFHKILSGKANSVDLDQTAHESLIWIALFACICHFIGNFGI